MPRERKPGSDQCAAVRIAGSRLADRKQRPLRFILPCRRGPVAPRSDPEFAAQIEHENPVQARLIERYGSQNLSIQCKQDLPSRCRVRIGGRAARHDLETTTREVIIGERVAFDARSRRIADTMRVRCGRTKHARMTWQWVHRIVHGGRYRSDNTPAGSPHWGAARSRGR